MELHELHVFQSVAKLGSISQAARELNYAQSNITTKIQHLEQELETILFYRHSRGITLTSKGKELLLYAEKIFHLIDETNKAMKDDHTPTGPLLIGSMETTAAVRLPTILSTYHHHYPDVDLTLKTGQTEQHVEDVLQYQLDGAFVAGPIEHPDLIQKTIIQEQLVLVTDINHPPLTSIKDIPKRTLLVFRSGCSYRARLEQLMHQEGIVAKKQWNLAYLRQLLVVLLLDWALVYCLYLLLSIIYIEEILRIMLFQAIMPLQKRFLFTEKIV